MQKATKIVATIGPATEDKETLIEMVKAGMNVARFNTKHSDPQWHNERIQRVREVADELNTPVATMIDIQGPEIRIKTKDEGSFDAKTGETVLFTSDKTKAGDRVAYVPHEVIHCISEGSLILLDDGACEFVVNQMSDGEFIAETISDCTVKHRKTMNTPGTILDLPSITNRDRDYLDKINPELIDYVALSFVRDVNDIKDLMAELEQRQIKARIIAKIENQAALDNFKEILNAVDGIMIARGDLGVEVDYAQLTYWQKKLINQCRDAAKPVITATQMLESMIENPRPTRAEVSDVAHAIYDGTDAVMLSGETTIGKYPVEAIKVQTNIAVFNEQHSHYNMRWPKNSSTSLNITSNAANMLEKSEQKIDKVICLTDTGYTARLLSRFRPKQPIIAVTNKAEIYRALSLSYGITPVLMPFPDGEVAANNKYAGILKKQQIVKTGETILMIHGSIYKTPGLTNTMTLIKVE